MTSELNGKQKEVSQIIWDGKFDLSKKEIMACMLIIPLSMYLSWESCKVYTELGSNGTKYLPVGEFTEKEGGRAAFWCNAVLNFWFLMDTAYNVRTASKHYQICKTVGIPTNTRKKAVKLIFSLLFAITAGSVMALIAGRSESRFNQIITGFVNTLLNLLGAIQLTEYSSKAIGTICYKNLGQQNKGITMEQLEERRNALNNIEQTPKESVTFNEYLSYSLQADENEYTPLLRPASNTKKTISIQMIVYIIIHIITQVFDKIANYGYWEATIGDTADFFSPHKSLSNHSTNNDTNGTKTDHTTKEVITGSIIFLPFAMLSVMVMLETVNDMTSLAKTTYHNVSHCKTNSWGKNHLFKSLFIMTSIPLALYCYYHAYISANSALELNAEYGWDDWWNTYPTVVGTLMFNGFGFLNVIMTLVKFGIERTCYDEDKRRVLKTINHLLKFVDENDTSDNSTEECSINHHTTKV